jgi:hypothetical protein
VRVPGHIVEIEGEGVTINLDGLPIYSAPTPPQQLALSSDGSRVAFVLTPLRELPDTTTPDTLAALMRTYASSSHVYVLGANDKEPKDLGAGYSPVFLDSTHLLRVTPEGMLVTDLVAQTTTTVLTGTFDAYRPLITSRDAAHVAAQTNDGTVHVYAVDATKATEVIAIQSPKGMPTVVTNDLLYTIAVSANGSHVWAYSLADGSERQVQQFPASFKVVKLLP